MTGVEASWLLQPNHHTKFLTSSFCLSLYMVRFLLVPHKPNATPGNRPDELNAEAPDRG